MSQSQAEQGIKFVWDTEDMVVESDVVAVKPSPFRERKSLLGSYRTKAACGVGQNPTRDKCTLSDGDSPATQQSSPTTKKPEQGKQQAVRALLKEAGGKLLSYKDAVKEVSNRFGIEIWNKMPPKAQQRLAKTWIVVKAIEHKVMLGFTKAKELAKQAGSERGLDESQVEKLGKLLAVTDLALAWTVNMPATIAATGSLTAGKLASWVPIASLFYLSYSTARNPLATVRAAKKLIRSQAKHDKALDRDMTDVAKLLAEKLKTSSDPDWFMALYSAALDETGDPVKALKLAEQAFQSSGQKSIEGYHIKEQGQPCKQGETSANTECVPASGKVNSRTGSQKPTDKPKPQSKQPQAKPSPFRKEDKESSQLPAGKKPKEVAFDKDTPSGTIDTLTKILGREIDESTLGAIANAIDGAELVLEQFEDKLSIGYEKDDVRAERSLFRDNDGNLVIHNDLFRIGKGSPHKGKGVEFFLDQVQALKEIGVTRIETHAAGGPLEYYNGYYTWPRMGYDGTMSEDAYNRMPGWVQRKLGYSRSVLDLMEMEIDEDRLGDIEYRNVIDALEEIDKAAKRPVRKREKITGADIWQVYGSDIYDATFDLADGSRSMRTLAKYLQEREQRAKG